VLPDKKQYIKTAQQLITIQHHVIVLFFAHVVGKVITFALNRLTAVLSMSHKMTPSMFAFLHFSRA
jgi:hypothetical protein